MDVFYAVAMATITVAMCITSLYLCSINKFIKKNYYRILLVIIACCQNLLHVNSPEAIAFIFQLLLTAYRPCASGRILHGAGCRRDRSLRCHDEDVQMARWSFRAEREESAEPRCSA